MIKTPPRARRALGLALLAVPLLALPAHADTGIFSDPRGDSDSPTTDIVSYTVSNGTDVISVGGTFAAPNNQPLDSIMEFDVNGDGIKDYRVYPSIDGVVTRLSTGADVCVNTPGTWTRSPSGFNFTLRSSCLGDPQRVRVAIWIYGSAGYDFAPDDDALSPFVNRTTVPTPPTPPVVSPPPTPPVVTPPPTPPVVTPPPTRPVVLPQLRISVSPATIRRGQSSKVCVRAAVGDQVRVYAYTLPSHTYRLVRSGTATTTLPCWTVAPGADTRLYATANGGAARQSGTTVIHVVQPAPAPRPRPVVAPRPAPAPSSVYYANCDAARRAGAAPIYAGEPGYRPGLDRDGDGIACE